MYESKYENSLDMSTRRAKRQGLIEPHGTVLKTTREKVYVEGVIEKKRQLSTGEIIIENRLRKKVMMVTTFETDQSYQIFIGNHEVYCINVHLGKNTNNQAYTGSLSNARWDRECSLDDPFEKGDDTILMIRFMAMYIKDGYPLVKNITFTDMSTKTCDNGGSVILAGMKVFMEGRTWYEEHFKVSMFDHDRKSYNESKDRLTVYKRNMSFDKFSEHARIKNTGVPIDEVRKLYEMSDTWQSFFTGMREKMGISRLCIWLSHDGWFDTFVSNDLEFNTQSIKFIFEPQVSNYVITYKIQHTNGGKRTKKRRT
jgi:hypothetical protein